MNLQIVERNERSSLLEDYCFTHENLTLIDLFKKVLEKTHLV